MKSALARTPSVLRRLVLAFPNAWRDDVVFRWSSIGAGACLLALLANSGVNQSASPPAGSPLPPLPPPALATAPTPVPAPPAKASLPSPAAGPPRIAPGRPLNSAASTPDTPDTDRFGTLQPHR